LHSRITALIDEVQTNQHRRSRLGPNRGGFRVYMIFMVDPSQSPKPSTCLQAFSPRRRKKGKLNNDRHHGKTDLAVVKQERQHTFGEYANQQHRRNSYQTNLIAAQPRSGLLAQVPALTAP
jgi:hypothetical protein